MDDETAVSPIIGVLLMVAVTTILAATLFFVVRGIGDQPNQVPRVAFTRNDLNGQLTVVQAQEPVDLADIEVRLERGGRFAINAAATSSSTLLPDGVFVPISSTRGTFLRSGDQINFCGATTPQPAEVVLRTLRTDVVLVYQERFNYMPQCA